MRAGFGRCLIGREMDEEPLASSFNLLDSLAGEGMFVICLRYQSVFGLKAGDGLAGEGAAERTGGAVDCVALRHELIGCRIQQSVPGQEAARLYSETR